MHPDVPPPDLPAGSLSRPQPPQQTAGRRVFWSNFDCEWEWAAIGNSNGRSASHATDPAGEPSDPQPARASRVLQSAAEKTRRWCTELAWSWLPMARPGDLIVCGGGDVTSLSPVWSTDLPTAVWQGLEWGTGLPEGWKGRLVPWGWTPSAKTLARQGSDPAPAPLPEVVAEVVAEVNARSRRWEWEQELGLALPGSRPIASVEELASALRALPDAGAGWVVKANFGMSGREAIRGRGTTVTEPHRRFVEQRLEATGPLVLEPWLTAVAEAGVQWEIAPDGTVTLVGVAEQRVAGGTWQGSRFSGRTSSDDWREAIDATGRVARRVAAAGYWGPLGIDCMRYRDATGVERLRPLQDLNARFTMGRLTLAWREHLPAGWSAAWRVIPPHAAEAVRMWCEHLGTARDDSRLAWRTTPGIKPGFTPGITPTPVTGSAIRTSTHAAATDSGRGESFPGGRCLLAAADDHRLDLLEHEFDALLERARPPA